MLFSMLCLWLTPLVRAGCSDAVQKEVMMRKITLHTTVKSVGNNLVLTYVVTNPTSRRLFLYNVFPKPGEALVEFDGQMVHVKKMSPSLLPHHAFQTPIRIFVTVVESGGTFSETLTLVGPVTPWSPYDRNPSFANKTVQARGLDFSLAYVEDLPHWKLVEEARKEGVRYSLLPSDPGVEAVEPLILKSEGFPLQFSVRQVYFGP